MSSSFRMSNRTRYENSQTSHHVVIPCIPYDIEMLLLWNTLMTLSDLEGPFKLEETLYSLSQKIWHIHRIQLPMIKKSCIYIQCSGQSLLSCIYYAACECSTVTSSYGDCLEVKREYYQNCSVLDCVTQCSQSAAHLYEQFFIGPTDWICHNGTLMLCIEAVV